MRLLALKLGVANSPAAGTEGRNARIGDTDPFASDWERVRDMLAQDGVNGEISVAYTVLVDLVSVSDDIDEY